MIILRKYTFKGGHMNNITDLLDLEDSDIKISDVIVEGQTKTLIIETPPVASYCPVCGFRMHSRGVKKRTITHPILQDGYSLILLLKQRRWRCSNPDCLYEVNESFRFVNKGRRTNNATDMLIVEAYRNLLETSASIAKRFLFATRQTPVLDGVTDHNPVTYYEDDDF